MIPTGWLVRDGLRLAIHDAGGDGRPVVFQHGLLGDATQTAEAFPAGAGFRSVTLECRGHGASGAGHDFSIGTFADDVAALIATLSPPIPVGGISMGAAIATRLAVTRPDLVRALVLVRPAWVAQSAPPNMSPNAEVGRLLATRDPATARAVFAASDTAQRLARVAPDNLASLMGFFDRPDHGLTASLLRAISADGPGIGAADLAGLWMPVLVCGTHEDAIHPFAHAEALAGLIPGARLVELPPKGRDKPAHLAALHSALSDFLKEL